MQLNREHLEYLERYGLDKWDRLVVCTIAAMTKGDGLSVTMRSSRLGELTGLEKHALGRHLNQLRDAGILSVRQHGRRGNTYQIAFTFANASDCQHDRCTDGGTCGSSMRLFDVQQQQIGGGPAEAYPPLLKDIKPVTSETWSKNHTVDTECDEDDYVDQVRAWFINAPEDYWQSLVEKFRGVDVMTEAYSACDWLKTFANHRRARPDRFVQAWLTNALRKLGRRKGGTRRG